MVSPKPITKYTIAVDTLHLMLKRELPTQERIILTTHGDINLFTVNRRTAQQEYYSDGFTLKRVESDDPAYHLQYNVHHGKNKVGKTYFEPVRGTVTAQPLIPLRLANAVLYGDYIPLIDGFLSAFDLAVNNITQLHIAIDTNANAMGNFLYYFDRMKSYHFGYGRQLADNFLRRVNVTGAAQETRVSILVLRSRTSAPCYTVSPLP